MSNYSAASQRFSLFQKNTTSTAEKGQASVKTEAIGKEIVQEGRAEMTRFLGALDKFLTINNNSNNKQARSILSETNRGIETIVTKGPEFNAEKELQAQANEQNNEHLTESQDVTPSYSRP
ncbi:Uncharacterised protein [Legionella beliardensis]|uniref:Uncharacterized protein n=1 Tax=Legionella beliardensis TaxID=91822 RepID=A0A378HZH4_9GAMM|nr:hypothetical protein [Legionella beliardensis]STX28143.1 Uncharacterised protein [Legionella beliardensis]